MVERNTDTLAAETAVAGIERLMEKGDGQAARFSLELLGPSFRVLADDDQVKRLNAVAEALGLPRLELADNDQPSHSGGP